MSDGLWVLDEHATPDAKPALRPRATVGNVQWDFGEQLATPVKQC